jgi:hypothetical protein
MIIMVDKIIIFTKMKQNMQDLRITAYNPEISSLNLKGGYYEIEI